jgi:hypothetical protein
MCDTHIPIFYVCTFVIDGQNKQFSLAILRLCMYILESHKNVFIKIYMKHFFLSSSEAGEHLVRRTTICTCEKEIRRLNDKVPLRKSRQLSWNFFNFLRKCATQKRAYDSLATILCLHILFSFFSIIGINYYWLKSQLRNNGCLTFQFSSFL